MKTQDKIDLLPVWARNAKARKSLIKKLAVVQIVVFLLLIAGIFLLNDRERQMQERYAELYARLAALCDSPSEAAERLRVARLEGEYIYEFVAGFLPADFAAVSLEAIRLATPQNSTMTRINYERQEILIVSETSDLTSAETHRANLSQSFAYVHMGRITRTGDGYTYEIRIHICDEA
ncbi:MAG: hypothetical protein FWB96_02155 [Defluviitaleaceae bacterium]|nr:hypothetical protein [Defluviitaleaceae bacterium]MCL2262341.1 hypothetical protein [Defluviitaleaceae bacterium]